MKYRIFVVTDKKVAILKGEADQLYKYEPPYKKCIQITYDQYFNEIYSKHGGIVYPESCTTFKSLKEIQMELLKLEIKI